jgi:gamma-glutamyltranspeptidase/glutathione hydrolase
MTLSLGGLLCELLIFISHAVINKSRRAVPGEVRGLYYLHQRYGTLPWASLINPSVQTAHNGFELGEYLNGVLRRISSPAFLTTPPWSQDFAPGGVLVTLGDVVKRERLAQTLRRIAKKGPDGFYSGPIAHSMIKEIQKQGGLMTVADLERYNVSVRDPVEIMYRGYRMVGTSAPSGSPVVLSALKILEGYQNMGSASDVNQSTHYLDEALRFGYGQVSKDQDSHPWRC